MPSEYRLKPRMAQFAREYVASGNAAASVRSSGYSASGATAQGVRLLAKVSVQREIARLRELQDVETAVDRTWVVNKLRDVAEHGEKEANRLRAAELLGKSVGLFVEQIEAHITHDVAALQQYTPDQLRTMLEAAKAQQAIETDGRVLDN